MNDISNKTLAVLVIIAIIVSLVGLYLGRIRLVTVGEASDQDLGLVEATLAADILIHVQNNIDFGNVVIGSTYDSLTDSITDPRILVASIGATATFIDYWADDDLGAANDGPLFDFLLLGGSNDGSTADASFQIAIENAATHGGSTAGTSNGNDGLITDCTGGISTGWGVAYDAYQNVIYSDDAGTASQGVVTNCEAVVPTARQGFGVKIFIDVPNSEPSGAKSATVNFRAVEYTGQT